MLRITKEGWALIRGEALIKKFSSKGGALIRSITVVIIQVIRNLLTSIFFYDVTFFDDVIIFDKVFQLYFIVGDNYVVEIRSILFDLCFF